MKPSEQTLAKLLPEARTLINKVVKTNMAEGILFSAGTDTSIIAYEAVKFDPNIQAITVSFQQGKPKDTEYVKRMVEFLQLSHETHVFNVEAAIDAAKDVVNVLKTFDPMDVRNTLPAYIGLKVAKEKGIKSVLTGDALDELFGYPWQFHLSETEFAKALSDMWGEMAFSSTPMGNSIGIKVHQPYLDPLFMNFSKNLPVDLKVNFHNGEKYGKWLLRKAYDGLIPDDVVWRGKAPLERGTGTWVLPEYFEKEMPTADFEEKKKNILEEDEVEIISKEQLVYYKIFRKTFGKPSEVYGEPVGRKCPKCKGYVNTKIGFCKICGNYPI